VGWTDTGFIKKSFDAQECRDNSPLTSYYLPIVVCEMQPSPTGSREDALIQAKRSKNLDLGQN
jgi:hypothetical protein